jgi:hypothetical protein
VSVLQRRYQRLVAAAMSLVMTALPVTALAAGVKPAADLTDAVAQSIVAQESFLPESIPSRKSEHHQAIRLT